MALLPVLPGGFHNWNLLELLAFTWARYGHAGHLRIERFTVTLVVHDQIVVKEQTRYTQDDARPIAVSSIEGDARAGERAKSHDDGHAAHHVVGDFVPPENVVWIGTHIAVDLHSQNQIMILQVERVFVPARHHGLVDESWKLVAVAAKFELIDGKRVRVEKVSAGLGLAVELGGIKCEGIFICPSARPQKQGQYKKGAHLFHEIILSVPAVGDVFCNSGHTKKPLFW